MSFLKNIFKHNPIEEELEEMYTQLLSQTYGMELMQARSEVKKAIDACIRAAKIQKTDSLPKNFGDDMLAGAKRGDPGDIKFVETQHREGVRDEDIREFWNLHDLQIRMIEWSEGFHKTAFVASMFKDNMTQEENINLSKLTRKTFPMYGNPDDTSVTSGDDRPLPNALHGRVDRWRMKMIDQCREQELKTMLEKYSTFNALIRDEIRKGNL